MAWQILYLPAEDPDTGDALWPEVFPAERLKSIRQQVGTPIYRCMYLGDPQGLLGEVFDIRWLRPAKVSIGHHPETGEVTRLLQVGEEKAVPFDSLLVYQFWDLAISEKQTADYTSCVTLTLNPADMSLAIVDVFRERVSFEKTQLHMVRLAEQWRPHAIGIENIAYQAAAVQVARNRLLFPIIEVKVDRDKVTRARLPAALAEQGKVAVVQSPLWTDDFLGEVAAFPGAPHDDMVDALSGAAALAQTYVPSSFFLFG